MSASLSYIKKGFPPYTGLSGSTKFIFFLIWSIAAMTTYDTRVLVTMFVLGVVFFVSSGLKWKDIRFAFLFMMWLIIINLIALFAFAPEQGVEIYGTRHEIVHLFWRYSVLWEELFYLFNFMMKYLAVNSRGAPVHSRHQSQRICGKLKQDRGKLPGGIFRGYRTALHP